MKIVICGGHHNSALVIAESLKEKGHQIFWFGHKYSMMGDKNPGAEYLEVTDKGFPFVEIKAGKLQPNYHFLGYLARIPLGFWQSFANLKKIKPELVFSFGGYLALPVAYMGWLLNIPVVTHEQTTVSGAANKLIAKVAKKIFVSFPSSLSLFPKDKTILTGLPIREEILKSQKKLFKNGQKTIYITGGKQGSHTINEAVFSILPQLLEKYNLIHQCGSTSIFNDIETANKLKSKLGEKAKNYLVKEYFFEKEIGPVFNSADLIVSRAGAHTVYELLTLKKPAILIPIPWSKQNEQQENAKYLESLGLAKIVTQDGPKTLSPEKLLAAIESFGEVKKELKEGKAAAPNNATKKILKEIEELL